MRDAMRDAMRGLARLAGLVVLSAGLAGAADTLISAVATAWKTNTTWKKAEVGAGALQVTRTATTGTTTAYVYGTAFTCTNLDVIEGMILHLNRLGAVGTITVALSDDNGVTDTRNLTVNAVDISAVQTEHYFTFAATLTCDGGVDYKVGIKHSVGGSGATVYRDATAGNWFHILQTNANPAAEPAAADNIHVVGFAVGMNQTATTDHGTLDVGQSGTLTYGTTAATAYYLKFSGLVNVWTDGTLTMGTSGARMPVDSTANLDIDSIAAGGYGLVVRGRFDAYGDNSVATTATTITADVAVNGTGLTSAAATGWLSGWEVGLPSTTATIAQAEAGDLNGDAAGTAITVHGFAGAGGGVAFAHSGTLPFRGELVLLTRNVKIHGASVVNTAYLNAISGSTINLSYAEFYWLGRNVQAGDGGVSLPTGVTGDVQYCAFHHFTAGAYFATNIATFSNNNVFILTTGNADGFLVTLSAGQVFDNNRIMAIGQFNTGAFAAGSSFSGNTVASSFGPANTGAWTGPLTADNNTFHSVFGNGARFAGGDLTNVTMTGWTLWRNGTVTNIAWQMENMTTTNVLLDAWTVYGKLRWNTGSAYLYNTTIRGGVFNSDAAFTATYGLELLGTEHYRLMVQNTTFGVTTAFTTGDIKVNASATSPCIECVCQNCLLASGGAFPAITGFSERLTSFGFQRWAQTDDTHRTYYRNGTVSTDAVIVNANPISQRLTPSGATAAWKLDSGLFRLKVADGATGTFTVTARKSAVADPAGANYGGAEPRLILKANYGCGIAETLLDTMTVGLGAWETLTGVSGVVTDDCILEAYVDSDGSTGWVNVADWSPITPDYWHNGLASLGLGTGGTGGTRSYSSGP